MGKEVTTQDGVCETPNWQDPTIGGRGGNDQVLMDEMGGGGRGGVRGLFRTEM